MAHRGPLRELFISISFLLLVKKAEKTVSPTHTGYILDAADEITVAGNATVEPDLSTPPNTGLLPLLLAFLSPLLFDLAEALGDLTLMYLLKYGLPHIMMLLRRFLIMTAWLASHLRTFSEAQKSVDRITRDLSAQISSLAMVSAVHTATISSLDQIIAENERRLVTITHESDQNVARLTGDRISLHAALLRIVDPEGIHPKSESVVPIVQDIEDRRKEAVRKLKRADRKIEDLSKAEDEGQLAQKDKQISTLTTSESILSRQVGDLEKRVHDKAEEAKSEGEKAKAEQTRLRKRLSDAESDARQARSPREYDLLRGQLADVVVELGQVRQDLEDERARTEELNAVKKDLEVAKNEAKAAEKKAEAAKKRTEAAEKKTEAAEKKTEAAQKGTETAENRAEAAEKKTEAAEKKAEAAEKKAEAKEKTTSEMMAKVNDLGSQLANAQGQITEAHHNGYLEALSQNQPSDQNAKTSDHTLSGHGQERENTSQEVELRGQIDQLTAANNNLQLERATHQADTQNQITIARTDERSVAQREFGVAQEQLREHLGTQWAGESRRLLERIREADADILRSNQDGRDVEQRLKDTVGNLDEVRRQLSNTQAINAQQTLEISQLQQGNNNTATQQSDLQEARDEAQKWRDTAEVEWNRAEGAEKQANEAKAETENYKKGKQDQDERIKDMNRQMTTLKGKIPANADLDAAEFDALDNSNVRACMIIEESVNRHYNYATRNVLIRLMKANDKIFELKVTLKNPATRSSRKIFLDILDDAEVDKDEYKALDYSKRQVIVRQCAAVNAKLAALRNIIKGSGPLNKDQLLAEIYKPRGDEHAVWDDQVSESEPESDEDDDDNDGDDGNGGRAVHPFVPLPARSRTKPSQQPEGQSTPMPSNANSDNPLKRKINPDENESGGSGKRQVDSDMGMRPIAGLFPRPPQQGSSPEADIYQSETKPESQDDLPSSEWIGEATAPQVRNIDQSHHSFQPGLPSSSTAIPTQVEQPFLPKPTKIPAPKAEAHLIPSERQERQAIGGRQDKNAAPAQTPVPTTGEGSTGFSFSVPRHISSGILPHVRKYTRLSKTTDKVPSRHRRTNPNTAGS